MPSAFLHPFAKPTRESFVRIVRGEGALLWDVDGREASEPPRAANELTLVSWDPVSKQPTFKVAAVRVAPRATGRH